MPSGGQQVNATMLTGLGENTVGPGLEKAPAGIRGLNQITGGGLPRGRASLVAGAAGAGKTLLGLEFLVGGARKYGLLAVLSFQVDPADIVAAGAFDLEREADLRKADDPERHLCDLRASISERQARLIAVRDQLIAEQTEIDRIDRRECCQVADTEADRVTLASRRWADVSPDSDVVPGNGGKK